MRNVGSYFPGLAQRNGDGLLSALYLSTAAARLELAMLVLMHDFLDLVSAFGSGALPGRCLLLCTHILKLDHQIDIVLLGNPVVGFSPAANAVRSFETNFSDQGLPVFRENCGCHLFGFTVRRG